MSDAESAELSVEADAGAAGPHATEAFALLGDETRLAILLVLWTEHDPYADDNGVPFSLIFERVGCDDPGNLSYHLEKLDGRFVRQRAKREGYELRRPGLKLVRAVIAGAGLGDVRREAAEIDHPCPFCDAPTTIRYRDGLVFWACTECEGVAPAGTGTDGALSVIPFEPAGLADRTPEELKAASEAALWQKARSLFDGVCPTCSGPIEGWLEWCGDHDPTGVCGHCGMRVDVQARFQCRICEDHGTTTPKRLALFQPAVISFYDDHGVSTRVHAGDVESAKRVSNLVDDHELDLVSQNPPRVTVTAALDGDEICVTFDETASVVDMRR